MDTTANAIAFLAFIFLAVALTIGAMAVPSGRSLLGFTSSGAWMLLGGFCYGQSASTWDLMFCASFLFFGMCMTMALMTGVFKERKELDMTADEIEEDGGEFGGEKSWFTRMAEKRRAPLRKKIAQRRALRQPTNFSKTGIIDMKETKKAQGGRK